MSGRQVPHRPLKSGSTVEDLIEMRFVLILLVAVALTLTWQTTVLADRPLQGSQIFVDHDSNDGMFRDVVADRTARK